jgi:ubiquitin carboxyl-terminal hydrolase L5
VASDTCIVVTDLPGLGANENSILTTRRSTRARKPARPYEEESETPSIAAPPSPRSDEHTPTPATRRNVKRKAAPEVFVTPENIIEASLQPWEENEQAEWPSWTELESDPVSSFPSLSRMMPCASQY